MIWNLFQLHSLKTRVTLFTLAIFLASIWSLSLYTNRMLREDMERISGEQQSSTVSFIAAGINDELTVQMGSLEATARIITPEMLNNPKVLQKFLEDRPPLQILFNGGIWATRQDGIAIVDIPSTRKRVGTNFMSREYMVAALKEGKATISKPIVGKVSKAPNFVMATPIRDTQNKVIGVLVGVTDLDKPSFLDKVTENHYGTTGGYLLIAPQHRLIVTATDKRRIMTATPAPGLVPLIDRFMQGYEGSGIFINPMGEEVLSSAKGVPVAGWQVVAQLPTKEALGPIHNMQQRLFLATIFLTMLAGALTWWMLRRQLAPMLAAVQSLATMSATNQHPQPLLITSQDEIGELIGGFNQLLEALQQQEEALRQSEERMRSFFENVPVGIFISTREGKFIYVNPALSLIFGYESCEELIAVVNRSSIAEALYVESTRRQAIIQELDHDPSHWRIIENRYRRKDGQIIDATLSVGQDGRDAASEKSVLYGIVIDITERKKSEAELAQHRDHLEELVFDRTAELAQSRDEAEAANRAKSIFLATMSHELRTPMNGVMGMIDLVLRRVTDPQQIDWLNKSKTSAKHLLDVITDILDISKIEADRLTLEEKNFSLSQVFDEVFQMQGDAAQAKGLHLSHEISPALPDLLRGDAMRLKQILINFTGNAIKFSETGQITVRAHAVEEDKACVLLRIEVTDQGIGISTEQQSRLFNAFTQVDGSMNRKFGGTGLGLIISRRIALLMGGDAGVISAEGQGSTFWFTAKLKKEQERREADRLEQAEKEDAETVIRQRYYGQHILVVDDESINLEIARIQLEGVDLGVDTAEDGAEAIAMARKNSYAAIFMDVQMPIVNGLKATRQIREIPGYRHTPIIAMTANAFAEDKARCFEAGMNDFLIKPFNPDQLFTTLLRALSQPDSGG